MGDTEQAAALAVSGTAESLLARILRRMNESGGFPALDHSVAQIVQALEIGEVDTSPLVNAVLADVSLTQKVLRLANSAMYAPIGRSVSTVSHALMVLGFEAVGHLALGVKLIGSMGQLSPLCHTAERELAHSLVAGSVAGSVVGQTGARNGEMGVVCSLLHRIGRLLVAFYLPEEWQRIQAAVAAGRSEADAAHDVLGIGLDDLGMQIAQQWRLPTKIVNTMRTGNLPPPDEGDAWLQALTRFSDQSAGIIASEAGEAADKKLAALAAKFGESLGAEPESLLLAVKAATDEVTAEPLLASVLVEKPAVTAQAVAVSAPPPATDTLSLLKAGLRDARAAIDEHGSMAEIERVVCEIVFRALDLSRTAILILDRDKRNYRVEFTLSAREPNRLVGFSMLAQPGADLAYLALTRKVDIYIDNPRDTKIASRLPDWARSQGLHPFFLLPIVSNEGVAMGLIYGQQQNDMKLSKEELGLLAQLRDLLQSRLRVEPSV